MVKTGSLRSALLARSALAGIGGTVVRTAFQRLVEIPMTGRADSYAPAVLVETVFRVDPQDPTTRRRLNNATHYTLGLMWARRTASRPTPGFVAPAPSPWCSGPSMRVMSCSTRRSGRTAPRNGPVRTGPSTSSTSSSRLPQPGSCSTGCWIRPVSPRRSQRMFAGTTARTRDCAPL